LQLTVLGETRGLAISAIRATANLRRLTTAIDALVTVTGLAAVLARIVNGASITIVCVDTAQDTAIDCDDVVQNDVAGATIVGAVATAADNFAIVFRVEVLDLNGATAIELHDLISSLESTTAIDVRSAAGLLERTESDIRVEQDFTGDESHPDELTSRLRRRQPTTHCSRC
jgi:hypothetical protein